MKEYRMQLIAHLENELRMLRNEDVPDNIAVRNMGIHLAHLWEHEEINEKLSEIQNGISRLVASRAGCALAADGESGEHVVQLITGIAGDLKKERKHLERWVSRGEDLIIVDPYFLSWSGPNKVYRTEREYTEYICSLIPVGAQSLQLYCLPGPNSRILHKFKNNLASRHIKFVSIETTEIHDRVFIREMSKAIVVGTSIGGYGNKVSFVLELPAEDLSELLAQLKRISKNT